MRGKIFVAIRRGLGTALQRRLRGNSGMRSSRCVEIVRGAGTQTSVPWSTSILVWCSKTVAGLSCKTDEINFRPGFMATMAKETLQQKSLERHLKMWNRDDKYRIKRRGLHWPSNAVRPCIAGFCGVFGGFVGNASKVWVSNEEPWNTEKGEAWASAALSYGG